MNKISAILLALLTTVAVSATAAEPDSVCHITGTVDHPDTREMLIGQDNKDMREPDAFMRVPVVDGKFCFDMPASQPEGYYIFPDYQLEEGSLHVIYFIAEPQQLVMHFGEDDNTSTGTGPETRRTRLMEHIADSVWQPVFNRLDAEGDSIELLAKAEMDRLPEDKRQAYADDFYADSTHNPLAMAFRDQQNRYSEAIDDYEIMQVHYMEQHPGFYALNKMERSFAYSSSMSDRLAEAYRHLYDTVLDTVMPHHPYHKDIREKFRSLSLTPGHPYIDYPVRTAEGNEVTLSSLFRGRIIYVDLWATWCGPCRRHLKELIPLYEKFKDKGFQVISIVGGRDAGAMKKAVEEGHYPWPTFHELNGEYNLWLRNGIANAGGGGKLIKADGTILADYPSAEETEIILKKELGR